MQCGNEEIAYLSVTTMKIDAARKTKEEEVAAILPE
jgi:hypothetical protein